MKELGYRRQIDIVLAYTATERTGDEVFHSSWQEEHDQYYPRPAIAAE